MDTLRAIAKGYDIRGIWGKDFYDVDVYNIGFAFGQFAKAKETNKVIIGFDNRQKNIEILNALISGLTAAVISEIENVGMVTSPIIYTYAYNQNAYGIMLTASHNDLSYNGIKFFSPDLKEIIDGAKIALLSRT